MRRAFLILVAGTALAGLIGCAGHRACDGMGCMRGSCRSAPETGAGCPACGDPNCPNCGGGRDGPLARHCAENNAYHGGGPPGPLTGAVAYPYYSLRGPRDFLARNPASIGP
jgi:hypothetical protein